MTMSCCIAASARAMAAADRGTSTSMFFAGNFADLKR